MENVSSSASQAASRLAPQKKIKALPVALLKIPFENISAWLHAYKEYKAADVQRAAIMAFRRAYLRSQADAAGLIGVTAATWRSWENGTKEMRHRSKFELVKLNWFKPQHFGLSAAAEEITMETTSAKEAAHA